MSLRTLVGANFYRISDSGPVVEAMQLALRGLGYPLKGTGFWANATDTAVRAFQKRAGLKADGVLGEKTATAIDAAGTTSINLAAGTAPVVTATVKLEIGRPLWLQAGIATIGTNETPGSRDNKTIIDWAKAEGGDIAKNYTHDSIPWCALWGNHILTKVSLPGTETLWALDFAGKWPSVRLDGLAVGAFAPMLRDGGGHIMVIVGRDQNGNIMGLGGNQSDAVNIKPFARSRLNKGFWWPARVPLPARTGYDSLPIVRSDGTVSSRES